MSFSTPLALLLLLSLPYFFWLGRPRGLRRQRWREWSSLAVRLLIVLLVVLSLAGIQAVRASDELAVAFLVDGSDSMSPEQLAQAEQFVTDAVATMSAEDQAAVILFGANALVDRPFSPDTDLSPISSIPQRLQTNLADAVRLALAIFPAGSARRIVVLSDGVVTTGDNRSSAELAAASNVPIDFVYLPRANEGPEAALLDVSAPSRVLPGDVFRIDISAESNRDMPADLRVLAGGNLIHSETVQLRPGLNQFAVRLQAGESEFARYQVQLTPSEDTYFQNNQLATFTEVVGAPRVLMVVEEAKQNSAEALIAALTATGLQIETITPQALPPSLPALSNYDSLVLVDVNAAALSPAKMEIVQSYVRDLGGGLVAVGGPQSYGMGGYFGTPLEEALPVEMQIKDEDRLPPVSIVIVVDRSGSMSQSEGGLTKIQLANEGAVRVVQLLQDSDDITVIPVDTEADELIGPLPASDKETAIEQIRQIGAGGGGIYVRTGLEAAAQVLAESANPVRHVIILADGGDAEEKEGVAQIINNLLSEGVTVSTVSIGSGPDTPWLREMAELGNGRFHVTDQAANLPQIFTQETTAIQRNYLVEERFFPALNQVSPILTGIDAVPSLYGYVATTAKNAARVPLLTHQGDPLLATWQYGLGRAVAWTSDATGRWGQEWVPWDGFAPFWTQAVRWTITDVADSGIETAVVYENGAAQLSVDARGEEGDYLNGLTLEANVVGPDGDVANVTLQQTAPGRYEASFSPDEEGAYLIRVAGSGEDGEQVGQTAGWVLDYSPEYRDLVSDPRLLLQGATLTGGRDLTQPDGSATSVVFSHDLEQRSTARPIWPWLLLVAALLLPIDVGLRRLVVTRSDLARAWAATVGRVLPDRPEPAPRPEQVSRLFEAKQRAGTQKQATSSGDSAEIAPDPILRQDATDVEAAPPPPKPAAAPKPTAPDPAPSARESEPEEGSLAAKLLARKRKNES